MAVGGGRPGGRRRRRAGRARLGPGFQGPGRLLGRQGHDLGSPARRRRSQADPAQRDDVLVRLPQAAPLPRRGHDDLCRRPPGREVVDPAADRGDRGGRGRQLGEDHVDLPDRGDDRRPEAAAPRRRRGGGPGGAERRLRVRPHRHRHAAGDGRRSRAGAQHADHQDPGQGLVALPAAGGSDHEAAAGPVRGVGQEGGREVLDRVACAANAGPTSTSSPTRSSPSSSHACASSSGRR